MSRGHILTRVGQRMKSNKKYWLLPVSVAPLLIGFLIVQIVDQVSPSALPAYDGVHYDANCQRILGCAWDSNRPNDAVKVEIYDNDAVIATVTANQFRQELLDLSLGNGKHGFTFDVTPQMRDGKLHVISIRVAGTQIYLQNTPKKIFCNPQ